MNVLFEYVKDEMSLNDSQIREILIDYIEKGLLTRFEIHFDRIYFELDRWHYLSNSKHRLGAHVSLIDSINKKRIDFIIENLNSQFRRLNFY